MKKFLLKQKQLNHPVEIIYMDKQGQVTQRTIFVKRVQGDVLMAFCTLRRENRTFQLSQILAAIKGELLYVS